ncbi:MFS transporter [Mucilaginibacter sp. PAMB04168]|uniref:MFS transporter n=1 Tax=Mucilaginibacter sp. PAMB04168 TaxID=3138567 RepID=UPI0031F716BD
MKEHKSFINNNTRAIIGIILVALALRPSLVSIGPSLASIKGYFGLSHASAALLISIPDLLMGVLALTIPWLVNKMGRNPLIIGSLVVIAVSTLARAYSNNLTTLLLTTVGIGTGIAIAGALLSGFVKANFPAKAALVMGIYSTSLSLGSTLSAVATAPILKLTNSWREATGIWALPALFGLIAWLFVYAKESKLPEIPRDPGCSKIPWKNGMAWRIALFFACVNFLFYSLLAWTATLYIEHGMSINSAGYILGCFTFFFMLSSPIFGALSKSVDRRGWLVASSAIALSGLLMIAFNPGFAPFVMIAIMAFGLGGTFTLGMTLPLDNTNHPDETNAWTAFVLTIGYLLASCGPLLLGKLRDLTGGFQVPMLTLVVIATAMLLLGLTLKPKPINNEDEEKLLQEIRELLD